ncbi:MAG: 50S ribosomal protein L21 [Alphaproteobacteria bacterium]|nr:50S ribosomal protein L21 [Alphaproteobacteria bacterium]
MFAVIKTGGKQYRVTKDDMIVVETVAGEPGSTVRFEDVLMIGDDGKAPSVGTPFLEQAAVFAEVVQQTRGDKIIVFKKKRRKGYRRKHGHRQALTVLRIIDISPTGTKADTKSKAKPEPKAKAKPKTEAKPKKPAKTAPAAKTEAKRKTAAKPKAKKEPKAGKGAAKAPAKASAGSKE